MSPLKALLFDFDGLLLDTEYPEYLSWQAIYDSYGFPLDIQTWQPGLPKGSDRVDLPPYLQLEKLVGNPLDMQAVRSERDAIYSQLLNRQELLPGVQDLLQRATECKLKMAVASSSPRHWVEAWLNRLQLTPLFSVVCCGDDVQFPKPNPELYLLALNRLGVSAEHAVAFEDSAVGIAAARGAGLRVVAIPNPLTIHSDLSGASRILNSMAEVDLDAITLLPLPSKQT